MGTRPSGGTPPTAVHTHEAFVRLDGFFDYPQLVGDAIAPHEAKLTPAERTRFSETFVKVVRLVAYPDSGAFLAKARLTYQPVKEAGKRRLVVVQAVLEEEDLETDIGFVWASSGKGWRIVDVQVDGASLVTDYANQFGRILEREGAKGLLGRLDAKLAELSRDGKRP